MNWSRVANDGHDGWVGNWTKKWPASMGAEMYASQGTPTGRVNAVGGMPTRPAG
jgi:hypothetical protein